MVVLNRIYTRTGDDGTTSLGTGARRKKYDLRVEAYGTVDEVNAVIGLVRLHVAGDKALDAALGRSRLRRSEARSAAATSTSSMLALSANARRWARTANSCCRNFESCDEEPEPSPQTSNERALAAPATPVLMHHPTHSIYWGR